MSEYKVAGTYIYTTAHYRHYMVFYCNTIFYRLTWGYNAGKKQIKIKTDQINHTTPKEKFNSEILIIIIGGLFSDASYNIAIHHALVIYCITCKIFLIYFQSNFVNRN